MSVSTPEDQLISIYRASYTELLERLTTLEASGRATAYERALLRETEEILTELDSQSRQWIEREIPRIYRGGQEAAIQSLASQGADTSGLTARITGIHRSAVETIAENMYAELRSAEQLVGRRVRDSIRQAGLDVAARGLTTGQTVRERKKHLQDILGQQGLTGFVDERGRRWRLDSYAEMVARTTTREATNLGTFNQLTDNGYDLVQMSTHYPTCDICSQYQGRVYSISGTDSRFPALYQTAMSEGYQTIHPNCRHVLTPWVDELATDDERSNAQERSNAPFEDSRSQRELNVYRNEQRRKRWQTETRRMRERYAAILPNDTPPPGAFARMRQADSDRWKELQGLYRDARREIANPITQRLHDPVRWLDVAEADRWSQERNREWLDGLGFTERTAVMRYKEQDARLVNTWLRNPDALRDTDDPAMASRLTDALDSALGNASTTQDMTVFRGIREDTIPNTPFDIDDLERLQGTVIRDSGFTSTTVNSEIAETGYGYDGIVAEIRMPKGSRAAYFDTEGAHTADFQEYEYVIARDSQFQIIDVQKVDGVTRLVMGLIS